MRKPKKGRLNSLLRRLENLATVSIWVPDAFALIYELLALNDNWSAIYSELAPPTGRYSQLSDEEARLRREVVPRIRESATANDGHLDARSAQEIATTSKEILNAQSDIQASRGQLKVLAMYARAIDHALAGIDVTSGKATEPHHGVFLNCLAKHRSLCLRSASLVLPKRRCATTGASLSRLFKTLVCIVEDQVHRVDYDIVDEPFLKFDIKRYSVGILPVALQANEIKWEKIDNSHFRVGLSPVREDVVVRRSKKALRWLLKSGVDFILMPELVSSGKLREMVSNEIRAHQGARVHLIVAGSEHIRSAMEGDANCAVVLDGSGELLWRQKKINPYQLTAKIIRDYKLTPILGTHDLVECGDSIGSKVVIRDLLGVGRCAVLICEDLSKRFPAQQIVVDAGVDIVFSPVMDVHLADDGGWRKRHAYNLSEEPRSDVAIANSAALIARKLTPPTQVGEFASLFTADRSLAESTPFWGAGKRMPSAILLKLIAPT